MWRKMGAEMNKKSRRKIIRNIVEGCGNGKL